MRTSIDRVETVHSFVSRVFSGDLHARRVLSLAYGALGVVTGASLAVAMIGHALAQARGLADKHAIKQVDRLLSNRGVRVWELFAPWIRQAVGRRETILVAMDWTDFDADDQTTWPASGHRPRTRDAAAVADGRQGRMKNTRNDFEDLCLSRLKACLPDGVAVTILADRGSGDVELFAFSKASASTTPFDFAAISKSPRRMENAARCGLGRHGGRARRLRDVEVTAARCKVPAVVCVHAKDMKEPWRIATSLRDATAREIVNHYAKSWTIEPGFRDTKDLRFGMGMSALRISDPQRRDRLLLLNALAVVLLTLLGAAGESLGLTGFSSPTPPSAEPIRCSVRAACSTISSPTCPTETAAPHRQIRRIVEPKQRLH